MSKLRVLLGSPFLFPADLTTWDGTTLIVDGNAFVVGDVISGGGGEVNNVKLTGVALARCGDLTPFLVGEVEPPD